MCVSIYIHTHTNAFIFNLLGSGGWIKPRCLNVGVPGSAFGVAMLAAGGGDVAAAEGGFVTRGCEQPRGHGCYIGGLNRTIIRVLYMSSPCVALLSLIIAHVRWALVGNCLGPAPSASLKHAARQAIHAAERCQCDHHGSLIPTGHLQRGASCKRMWRETRLDITHTVAYEIANFIQHPCLSICALATRPHLVCALKTTQLDLDTQVRLSG